MMWSSFLLILLGATYGVKADFVRTFSSWAESIERQDNVAECLAASFRKTLRRSSLTLRLSIEAESQAVKWEHGQTLDRFLATSSIVAVDLGSSEEVSYSIHIRIYFIDTLESLIFLINRQHDQENIAKSRHDKYLIVLPASCKHPLKIMRQILKFLRLRGIINVCVLVEDSQQHSVSLYTFYPFNAAYCNRAAPVIQNSFVNGSYIKPFSMFFPHKDKNLWQCPLRVALWQRPPFIDLKHTTSSGSVEVSGMDGTILKSMAAAFNFTIQVIVPVEGKGAVYPNGTAFGAFGMLKDREADMIIGFTRCSMQRKKFLSATDAYYISNVKLIMQRPSRYSPVQILLFPFDIYTWIAIFCLQVGRFFGRILWWVLLLPCNETSKKLLLLSWLVSSFILCSAYGGSIFKFLQNRPPKILPRNVEEAIEAGYKLLMARASQSLMEDIPVLKDNVIVLNVSERQLFDESDRYSSLFALIGVDDFFTCNNHELLEHEEHFVAEENVLTQFACIYLQKISFLTKNFNVFLRLMTSHGLIKKIHSDFVHTMNFRKQVVNKKVIGSAVKKLGIREVSGAFKMLALLLGLGVAMFLVELLVKRNRIVGHVTEALQ